LSLFWFLVRFHRCYLYIIYYNCSWILCLRCINIAFSSILYQNKIFFKTDFVNNSVWSWNMGLRVKGGPKKMRFIYTNVCQTRFKFSICFWALALEFLVIWLWNVLNGNKLMLSTERTFGDACTRIFDDLWNDKGKNECCQLKALLEVPFRGSNWMRKKRQIAPCCYKMGATAFAKAALQLTDFSKWPLATTTFAVGTWGDRFTRTFGDKFALLRPTHFLFQARQPMQQFRSYVPGST
jgi:hypothetical protein